MLTDQVQVTDQEYAAGAQRFGELIEEFEVLPLPEVREKVFELLKAVDVIHRAGLSRLAGFLQAAGQEQLLEEAAQDETVRTLLLLYDLLPGDELTQAEAALEAIRPYMHSHGGEVEVLGVEDGMVHLRLAGACHGCAGSTLTLRRGIQAALRDGFPGFKGMRVHESAPDVPTPPVARPDFGANFIPLAPANGAARAQPQRPIFLDAVKLDDVPPGARVAVDVARVRVLIANIAGEIYAVRDNCPGSMAPLDLGSFTPPVIVCPWHNEPYDIRTGRRVDGVPEPQLQALPVALAEGMIRVAVNVAAPAG